MHPRPLLDPEGRPCARRRNILIFGGLARKDRADRKDRAAARGPGRFHRAPDRQSYMSRVGNLRALIPRAPIVTNAPTALANASGARCARYGALSPRGIGCRAIRMIPTGGASAF